MKRLGTLSFVAIAIPTALVTTWFIDRAMGKETQGLKDFIPGVVGILVAAVALHFYEKRR